MARKTEEVALGSDRYVITQLGAERGAELYDDLLREMAPLIKEKFGDLGAVLSDKSTDEMESAAGFKMVELLASVPKALKRELRTEFKRNTKVYSGGVPIELAPLFDEHFAGRYGDMMAWELQCLRINFLNFLSSEAKPQS